TGFRADPEHDSGLKANRIPGGSRTLFGLPRNGVRLGPGMISTGSGVGHQRRQATLPKGGPIAGQENVHAQDQGSLKTPIRTETRPASIGTQLLHRRQYGARVSETRRSGRGQMASPGGLG